MKIIKQIGLIVLIIMTMTACANKSEAPEVSDSERDAKFKTTNYVSESGTIRLNQSGAMRLEDESIAPVTVDFFFDPVCSACSKYTEIVGNAMKDAVQSGSIELVLRPVPYLNDKTPDDYSNRASAYILAVSEYAPSKSFDFVRLILSDDFRPDSPATDTTPDSNFIKAMGQVGLDDEDIDKVEYNKENFVSKVIAAANDFYDENSNWAKLSNYKNESGKQMVFTPFILVNKTGEDTAGSLDIDPNNLIDEFNKAIKDKMN